MDEQTDDPDDAVMRLESALERIAQRAGRPGLTARQPPENTEAADPPLVPVDEIAARLDQLINRLRAAVANKPG